MRVYWRTVKRGQNLVLNNEADGSEERIGGFRENKGGIDAYATTFGYDPGRSQKGFSSIEEAKDFVESFKPWELYESAQGATVEPEVLPSLEPVPAGTSDAPQEPVEVSPQESPAEVSIPDQPEDTIAPEQQETTSTVEQPQDTIAPDQPEDTNTAEQPTESMASDPQPRKRWWEFWKGS